MNTHIISAKKYVSKGILLATADTKVVGVVVTPLMLVVLPVGGASLTLAT